MTGAVTTEADGVGAGDGVVAYAALDEVFSVASDDLDVLELIDRLYTHCRTDSPPQHHIELVADERGWALGVDGVAVLRDAPPPLALERMAWEVNQLAWASDRDALLVHAGAVEIDGKGVVLCAGSGRGKSTLTMGLCERGARYMSDEIAVIDVSPPYGVMANQTAARSTTRGFSRPIALRDQTWHLVEQLEPNCPPEVASFMEEVWFVVPPDAADVATVDVIVFPIYDSTASDRVELISKKEAAAIIGDQTPNMAQLGASALEEVERLVASSTTVRLVYSDLAAACALVRDVAAGA